MAAEAKRPTVEPVSDETANRTHWRYLDRRPHPRRRPLYLKGSRLSAFSVWSTMQTEGMSIAEAATDWQLPLGAIREVILHCEENRERLGREADQEKQWLLEYGVALEPTPAD